MFNRLQTCRCTLAGLCLFTILLLSGSVRVHAFALMGPVQSWMQSSNVVVFSGEIGGPMERDHEYRWNVPLLTYGFDQTFLDFFGSNGVAAVEEATRMLNDLPPSSAIALHDYPLSTHLRNLNPGANDVYDLKLAALRFLLEESGLRSPSQSTFVLRKWHPDLLFTPLDNSWTNWAVPDYVEQRNYDPYTLSAMDTVNGTVYSAQFYQRDSKNYCYPFPVDPSLEPNYSVIEALGPGLTVTGLTFHDVGGLRYLLSKENVNCETLLRGVEGDGTNLNGIVNAAFRPGVEKVSFIPHPIEAGSFIPYTNHYVDAYFTNGVLCHQQLRRAILQPDVLFTAGMTNFETSASNWLNNSALNFNSGGEGPGVICPPIKVSFARYGRLMFSEAEETIESSYTNRYGFFPVTTNGNFITFPQPHPGNASLTVLLRLRNGNQGEDLGSYDWTLTSPAGTVYSLQTSTNLADWVTLFTVANDGSVCHYVNTAPTSARRFYRVVEPKE